MSGQPVKNAGQQNKFRNEYMETLNLQAEINDMNLQANKNYLMTGQLPTASQLIDTRTTTEKLEDVEKLKKDISDKLAPIADPAIAYAITNKILNSPLNIGNSLFRFLAQRIGAIVEEIKKIYPYGISYEPSDIERIVSHISNMYSEQQGKLQSVRSYLNTASTSGIRNDVVNGDNIDPIRMQLENILLKINRIRNQMPIELLDLVDRAGNIQGRVFESLPTTDEIKRFNELVKRDIIFDTYYTFFKNLEELPKMSQIQTILNKLDKFFIREYEGRLRPNEVNNVEKALKSLVDIFSGINIDILERDGAEIKRLVNQGQNNIDDEESTPGYSTPSSSSSSSSPSSSSSSSNSSNMSQGYNPNIIKNQPIFNIPGPSSNREEINVNNEEEMQMSNDIHEKIETLEKLVNKPRSELNDKIIKRYNNMIEKALDDYEKRFGKEYEHIVGVGIKPKRRVGRPRGCGIVKVEKPPMYVGFGINEINRKKMNEKNILTVRRNNSRTNIPDFPSRHISDGFKNVLNTITGGGIPKFNDMSKLSEEEQEYLYKLVSKSNLEDKLSVPAPSKDGLEKDFHEFEKMKGEILSGNDSKELVKKFKGLIMKLSRNGFLPKGEVNELLELLTSLSY